MLTKIIDMLGFHLDLMRGLYCSFMSNLRQSMQLRKETKVLNTDEGNPLFVAVIEHLGVYQPTDEPVGITSGGSTKH